MKLFAFISLFCFCFTATAGDSRSSPEKFAMPVLSPEKVVELTENYLKKEKQINLNNYDLARLEFAYYTSPDRPRMIDSSGWFIGYNCKKAQLHCEILIVVSNTANPKFTILPH